MLVVGVVGAYTLVFLVHGFLRHHKLIAVKTDAVYEIVYGQELSEMAQKIEHEVRTQAKHEGEVRAQQRLELAKRQEREKKQKEDLSKHFDTKIRPYVTDMHRGALSSAHVPNSDPYHISDAHLLCVCV